jgi:hypothetical protein
MPVISKKKLWEAQLREYPDSERLNIRQVLDICSENRRLPNEDTRFGFTYMKVCLALQFPNVVFYRIPTPNGICPYYWGFRYGLHGSQYASC